MLIKNITGLINAIIFSDLCYFCKKNYCDGHQNICEECQNKLTFIKEPFCDICGRPFINIKDVTHTCGECIKVRRQYSKARSVFVYDDIIRQKILEFKFVRDITLAKVFSNYILRYLKNELDNQYDVIIPVPLHKKRLKERYFNQALLLVDKASYLNQIKVDKYSLKRIKYTTPQVFLKGKERVKNVKGAFRVKNAYNIKDKTVLLVDDIYTTGATVNECSNVLRKAGALDVDVLTLAKTVIM